MKIKHIIIGVLTAAVLSLTACDTAEVEQADLNLRRFNQPLLLTASWGDSPATKTAIQGNGTSVWWTTDENLNVFFGAAYSGKFVSSNTEPAASAEFSGILNAVEGASSNSNDQFWAVYPYNEANTCDGESVTLTVPSTQVASEGTFADNLFPAVARSSSLDMQFYNVCGGACFTVSQDGIRSLVFKGVGNEALAGKVKVAFDAAGRPEVKQVLEGETTVTVFAPDGTTFKPGKKYYAVLLPQTLANGLVVTYRTSTQRAFLTLDRSIPVTRSKFGLVENLDAGLTFEAMPVDRSLFTDKDFADMLFEQYDLNRDNELSAAECAQVEVIEVNYREFESLQGIEYFPNLRELYSWGDVRWENGQDVYLGKLTSLDVSKNTHLVRLECPYNHLTSLDLSKNTELQQIDLGYNHISQLNLPTGDAMTVLKVHANDITALNVSSYTALVELSFFENPISSINLSNNTALERLNASSCPLNGQLDLSHNTELTTLQCGNIGLSSINLSNQRKLQSLELWDNPIGSIDLSNNADIYSLSVGNMSLAVLDVSQLPKLRYLYCYSNSLSKLDVTGNPLLYTLNCANNPFTSNLDLTKNQKLRNLYCSSCNLTSLDLSECIQLYNLECEYNQLTVLDVSENPSLNSLYAYGNVSMTTLYVAPGQYDNIRYKSLPEGVNVVEKAASGISINETAFPDAGFRNYVLNTIDKNHDGVLTNAERKAVTYIEVCTDTVASLAGIAQFPNLTELHCCGTWTDDRNGKLTEIDLSGNTALQYLYCWYNPLLTALDLSCLPDLRAFNCGYCEISTLTTNNPLLQDFYSQGNPLGGTLDLSAFPELQYLQCYDNQLTALNVSNNPKLVYLSCQNNQLTEINVSSTVNLLQLYVQNNNLGTLDVRNNSQLRELNCQNTGLSSMDVSNNTELQYFNCSYNEIEDLNVSNNSKLTRLYCRNNKLSVLDVSNNLSLQYLNCLGNNNLTTLYMFEGQTIPSGNFYKNDFTEIVYVRPLYPADFTDANFRQFLFDTYGEGGVITDATRRSITTLSFTTDGITSLEGIQHFVNLETLVCVGSVPGAGSLAALDVSLLPGLKDLVCSYNQIGTLDLSGAPDLEVLACPGNNMTSLNVASNILLQYLDCSGNPSLAPDISNLAELDYFDCTGNGLTEIDVTKNSKLKQLSCADNALKKIDLSRCTLLEKLVCDNNSSELTEIDMSVNPALKTLTCENNSGLQTIWVPKGHTFTTLLKPSTTEVKEKADDRGGKNEGYIPGGNGTWD